MYQQGRIAALILKTVLQQMSVKFFINNSYLIPSNACRDSSLLKPAVEEIKLIFFQSANVSYVTCCEESTNQSTPGKMSNKVCI